MTGWTVDTLHEHLSSLIKANDHRYEQRFQDAGQAVDAALKAAEKAVTKAEMASEKRFEGVNEFRAALSDQTSTFLPRSEADARISALADKIDALNTKMDKSEGKGSGLYAGWGLLVGAIGIAAAMGTLFVTVMRQ